MVRRCRKLVFPMWLLLLNLIRIVSVSTGYPCLSITGKGCISIMRVSEIKTIFAKAFKLIQNTTAYCDKNNFKSKMKLLILLLFKFKFITNLQNIYKKHKTIVAYTAYLSLKVQIRQCGECTCNIYTYNISASPKTMLTLNQDSLVLAL